MKLTIDGTTRIGDIQHWFSKEFSFLKLEFFRTRHLPRNPSPKNEMRAAGEFALKGDLPLEAQISIDDKCTVMEVENLFLTEAGLYVQVFRKSGSLWIETTLTDDWTLEQQNHEGESLSVTYPVPFKISDKEL